MNIKIGKNLRSNNLDKLVLNPILYEINHHTDIKIEIKKENQLCNPYCSGIKIHVNKKKIHTIVNAQFE